MHSTANSRNCIDALSRPSVMGLQHSFGMTADSLNPYCAVEDYPTAAFNVVLTRLKLARCSEAIDGSATVADRFNSGVSIVAA